MKLYILILGVFLLPFVANAQDDEIIEASNTACECLNDIDITLEKTKRYEEIKACISSATLSQQLKKTLLGLTEKVKDTLDTIGDDSKRDSITIPGDQNIIIETDKNYREIENDLLRNCSSMKLLMSNDDTQSDVSVSEKKKALKYYEKGQDYFARGNYENAIVEYSKAVKKDKKFAFAWDMLGYSYRKLNNFKEAIKNYDKSLEVDPKGKMPLMNKPIAYLQLNDFPNAIVSYKDFIEVYPDDPEPYYGIGRVYHLQGDYEKAIDNTMKAYNMYMDINSPYARDAEHNLSLFYTELKEKNQLDLFLELAKKHKINIE